MPEGQRAELLSRILNMDARLHQMAHVGNCGGWLQLELTVPQLKTLVVLSGRGAVRMSQLSQMLGATVSTMTGIVDRLVERGLVERKADAEDRRIVLVQVSEMGRAEVGRLFLMGREHMGAVLDHVSTEDLAVIARALDIMHQAAAKLHRAATQDEVLDVVEETG